MNRRIREEETGTISIPLRWFGGKLVCYCINIGNMLISGVGLAHDNMQHAWSGFPNLASSTEYAADYNLLGAMVHSSPTGMLPLSAANNKITNISLQNESSNGETCQTSHGSNFIGRSMAYRICHQQQVLTKKKPRESHLEEGMAMARFCLHRIHSCWCCYTQQRLITWG